MMNLMLRQLPRANRANRLKTGPAIKLGAWRAGA